MRVAQIPYPHNDLIGRAAAEPKALLLPCYTSTVPAGFPSPADDHLDDALDLNKLLVTKPAATYYIRAAGDSMADAGIQSGDILVVDRSIESKHHDIVIAMVDGGFTVKRLYMREGVIKLLPENQSKQYPPIEFTDGCEIWGVVSGVVRKIQRR